MTINSLEDLFVHELEQMYYAENQLVDVMETLVDDASNDILRKGFSDHLDETRGHVDRIERVFDALGRESNAEQNQVIDALVKEHDMFASEVNDEHLHDLYDMQAGMKTERIEITAYQGLLMLAGKLDYSDEITDPLEDNLSEEKSTLRELEGVSKGSKIKSIVSQIIE